MCSLQLWSGRGEEQNFRPNWHLTPKARSHSPTLFLRKTATAPRSPYSFWIVHAGSFTSHRIINIQGIVRSTGPPAYLPYPRLESQTICRWNYRGSTFSSVILKTLSVGPGRSLMTSHVTTRCTTKWATRAQFLPHFDIISATYYLTNAQQLGIYLFYGVHENYDFIYTHCSCCCHFQAFSRPQGISTSKQENICPIHCNLRMKSMQSSTVKNMRQDISP